MKFTALICAVVVAGAASVAASPAGAVVVATYSGTITQGSSAASAFGTQSLVGKHFDFTVTFDPAAGFHGTIPPAGDPLTSYHYTDIQSNAVGGHTLILKSSTLTIGSGSDTLDWTAYNTFWQQELMYQNTPAGGGFFYLSGSDTKPAPGGSDIITTLTRIASPTNIPYVLENGWSPQNDTLADFSFSRAVGDPRNGYSLFYQLDAHIDSASIRDIGAVPEPQAWALMIAGFGLAGTAIRRRRTVRA